jgi:hypothetical protein
MANPYFNIILEQIDQKKDLEMPTYAKHVKMVLQDAVEHLTAQVNEKSPPPCIANFEQS